jgi:hypothetical protein
MQTRISIGRLLTAIFTLGFGLFLGLGFLELLFWLQPELLFRGMPVPAPVEQPIQTRTYDVWASDADVFLWRPDLVSAILPEEDYLEARVVFQTDEFGFRNEPPLSENVDVVVLGRSHSLAAHLPENWSMMLEDFSEQQILNLAYPGGNLGQRKKHLKQFGLTRNPRWVILEVTPSNDIIGNQSFPITLIPSMTTPLVQGIWRQLYSQQQVDVHADAIYPLRIELPDREKDLICCIHFMEFFGIDMEMLKGSQDWLNFEKELEQLSALVKDNHACLALLYIPTKPTIYFPLALNPEQLTPTLHNSHPYSTNSMGYLIVDNERSLMISTVMENIDVGRDLLEEYAAQNALPFIDPTDEFRNLVAEGGDPFMKYESHWNKNGHQITAQLVNQLLRQYDCP